MRVRLPRRREPTLPYNMFDLAKESYEAKKADVMEGIYHRSQERAWSGKELLPMLIEEHGEPDLPEDKREALARIFAIILWGELAAWKISAQLADAIEPLEAKMAATSQSFDEARHFYTMYDYLSVLGYVPEHIDRLSERVLDLTLRAKSLPHKLCGMQLMIETIALTIFQTVRKQRIEPVLAELLRYFEIDEARHVGLGINYLPTMIKQMGRLELFELMLFQMRLMVWTVASMRALKADLITLGIDARDMWELGKAKQFEVFRETWAQMGIDIARDRPFLSRVLDAVDDVFFPRDESTPTTHRLRSAISHFVASETSLDDRYVTEAHEQFQDRDTTLSGMGSRFKWRRRSA